MAPSGKGQQKPKYSSPKPKPKPKNKVAQQLLQRSRETASSHSFYLSIPPLCLFFQPLIYVSIYLQYYYPSFSLYTDTNNKWHTQCKKKHGNSTHPSCHQNQRVHTTQPNPLSLSSMAQLDQNLCRRKKNKKETKKERKNGKTKKKEKLDVFKCPPTKPTLHFSLSHQNYVPLLHVVLFL